MPPPNHRHRPSTSLRQTNKKHKSSTASNRSIHKNAGGKVNKNTSQSSHSSSIVAKADRNHISKQRRDASKKKLLEMRRKQGKMGQVPFPSHSYTQDISDTASQWSRWSQSIAVVPRIIGLISLSALEDTLEHSVRSFLLQDADVCVQDGVGIQNSKMHEKEGQWDSPSSITAQFHSLKKDGTVTLLTNSTAFRPLYYPTPLLHSQEEEEDQQKKEDASVLAALDLCRICDLVVFLVHNDDSASMSASTHHASSTQSLHGHCLRHTVRRTMNTNDDPSHAMEDEDDPFLEDEDNDEENMDGDRLVHSTNHTVGFTNNSSAPSKNARSQQQKKIQQDFDHFISRRGDRILAALKAQGLPTPLTVLVNVENSEGTSCHPSTETDGMSVFSVQSTKGIRRLYIKRKQEVKKYMTRFVTTEFGEGSDKLMELDVPSLLYPPPQILHGPSTITTTSTQDEKKEDVMNWNDSSLNGPVLPPSGHLSSQNTLQSRFDSSYYPTKNALIRTLCTMRSSTPKWVADMPRPYIVSNGCALSTVGTNPTEMSSQDGNGGYHYEAATQELKITGYIRGKSPWNVNSLIHIPNLGTYAVKCIEKNDGDVTSLVRKNRKKVKKTIGSDDHVMVEDIRSVAHSNLILTSDESKRESVRMFVDPDALEGEQNLIGFDDDTDHLDHIDDGREGIDNNSFHPGVTRPAGWSDYQASWLDAIDDENNASDDEGKRDQGELAYDLNKKKSIDSVVDAGAMDTFDDFDMNPNEKEKNILVDQRRSNRKDDLMFPDEVELQREEKARERLARYRSIKSFRNSYWDPKENLPESYGTIYHFASFKATQGDVMAEIKDVLKTVDEAIADPSTLKSASLNIEKDIDMDEEPDDTLTDIVPVGSFVTVTVEGVQPADYDRISGSSLLSAVCLLPHENKVSVIQMGLCQSSQCDESQLLDTPVKSKDSLIFRCGWRTWQGRPIFSQNNLNSDKHKFERFMPMHGAFFASSVFGPVTYTPCPVLVFRQNHVNGTMEFVAHGNVIGADADRIVVKRIVLTGYPTRVHKRHATVKYMFYDPEDVKWFQPAGLTTKHGLQGNILQSVGDHGTMKCLFNAPIKQHDTVCLPLYKRVFPKFAPSQIANSDGSVSKHDLLVL